MLLNNYYFNFNYYCCYEKLTASERSRNNITQADIPLCGRFYMPVGLFPVRAAAMRGESAEPQRDSACGNGN